MARIVKLDDPKTGKARYRIRVFNGSDPRTGRKIVITKTVTGEAEAKAEAARLEKMRADGTLTNPSKESLLQYLTRWLDDVKKLELRPRTWDDYKGIVTRYIESPPKGAPNIGVVRMHRLGRHAIQQLYTHLWKAEGLSPRTIRYLHSVLRQALSRAVKVGDLATNPTDHVTLPSRSHGGAGEGENVNAMDEAQAAAFLEAARSDRYYPLWVVLVTGGLRPGEALALTWDDVDLEGGKLHVRRALTRRGLPEGESWRLQPPKTDRARRVVVLPPVAVQALKEWRAKTGRERLQAGVEYEARADFVFCNEFGKPLSQPNLYSRNFRRVMAKAGLGEWQEVTVQGKKTKRTKRRFIPGFRMYDLRHTCATTLLKRGINPKIVSERLGHASITLTLDTYSHVLPDMQSEAAEAMERAFGIC